MKKIKSFFIDDPSSEFSIKSYNPYELVEVIKLATESGCKIGTIIDNVKDNLVSDTENAYYQVIVNYEGSNYNHEHSDNIKICDVNQCIVLSDKHDILAARNKFGTLTIFVRSDIIINLDYNSIIEKWYREVYINPDATIPVLNTSSIVSGKLDPEVSEWMANDGEY